jgi:nitrogen regulatory protein P-II 2
MQTVPMKRVTIVGDDCVKYRILEEILELGGTGYTDWVVHGKGARGVRPRHAEPPNSKIEVIATLEVANRILEHIARNYFDKYAMIAFVDDVEVIRGEKFGAKMVTKG